MDVSILAITLIVFLLVDRFSMQDYVEKYVIMLKNSLQAN